MSGRNERDLPGGYGSVFVFAFVLGLSIGSEKTWPRFGYGLVLACFSVFLFLLALIPLRALRDEVEKHRRHPAPLFAWPALRRKPAEPLPPGPPNDAHLYDCDGIPVSFDETLGSRAWDRPEPRKVSSGFTQSEGVPIDRERFDELRTLWWKNHFRDPFA